MTVRVRYLPNPFDASIVEACDLAWRDGLTVDDAIPARLVHRDLLTVVRGCERVSLTDPVADGDVLTVCAIPGEVITATLASLVQAGYFATTGAFLSQAAALTAVQVVIAAAGYALLADRQPGKRRGDELSPVYGFSGPGNIRVEGQPRPLIYGRFRYPGVVINEFTRTRVSPAETDLYSLISFGYGPIHKIDGLDADTARTSPMHSGDATFPVGFQINGNDAANLDGITCAVRLGTPTQEVTSGDELGFDDTVQRFTVSLGLSSTETTAQDNSTLAFDNTNYTTATADDHFDDFGAAYSMTEEFDRFRAVVTFPGGLYRISSVGNNLPTYAQFALRYIELDNSNLPITTGGPEGDGYVRLPLENRLAMSQRSAFSVEYEHIFYDPQSYEHPTGSTALVLDGTNDSASNASMSLPGSLADEFSMSCWVNFDTLSGDQVIVDHSTGTTGFKWYVGPHPQSSSLFVPFLAIRNGANWDTFCFGNSNGLTAGQWHFVAFSYKKNAVFLSHRVRLWLGNSQGNGIGSSTNTVPSLGIASATFYIGRSQAGANWMDGRVDELEWIDFEFGQTDISTRWATGFGFYLTPTSDHVGLWHFDVDSTTDPTPEDESTRNNDLTLNGGASIPSGANGKVLGPPSAANTPKRSKYKVEIVRVNEDSTHERVSDDCTWTEAVGVLDQEFSYPSTPLLAAKIKATEQLNTTIPTYTDIIEGRLVRAWDGLSASDPTFSTEWTRNPAWIALDLILDTRYGLGNWFSSTSVDIQSFQDLADYADELIYDHQGQFEATGEWTDLTYTGSSGTGSIVIAFDSAAYANLRWSVGDSVGFSGVPVVGGGADINNPAPSGYEITEMDGAAFTVTIAVALGSDPWTSGTALSSHTTVDGTVEGREPRYCFDGAFDVERPAWDCLLMVLATARAVPIREGNRIRVKYEYPRDAVDIVGMASIQPDTFEIRYGGKKARANSLTVELLDEDQNYDRVTVKLDHPSVENATEFATVRPETLSVLGICRRSQALRHAAWLLNVNDTIVRDGTFVASADALSYEPGDVLQVAPDVLARGDSGAVYATDTDTTVKLDQTVTLAAATTYVLRVRNSVTGLYETQTVTSVAGTYALGTAITVGSAFTFTPQRDDRYVLSVEDSELLVQVQSISLQPDLSRMVEWVEYDASVYEDDWFDDIDAPTASSSPAMGGLIMPEEPNDIGAREVAVRGPGDNYETHLLVSWTLEEDTAEVVERIELHLSLDGGPWERVATVAGKATTADVNLGRSVRGSVATIAVQPVSLRGAKRRPDACANVSVPLLGIAMPPEAPSALAARMDGELAVYSVTAEDSTAMHEVRRGGWILGDHVATLDPARAQSVPIPSWASVFGPNAPYLYARAFGSSGFYSDYALLNDTLAPSGARTVPAAITAANENWASYGDGWKTDSAPPPEDPTLTGFETVDNDDGTRYLQFEGSNLTATYETGYDASAIVTAIRAFVEAWWDAEQVHPLAVEAATWAVGDPLHSRWTAEGPMTVLAGEEENCTLKVQIRIDDDGGGSLGNWQDLVSGSVLSLADAQFKLVATRPSTDYQIKIHRFITRIRQQAFADTDTY